MNNLFNIDLINKTSSMVHSTDNNPTSSSGTQRRFTTNKRARGAQGRSTPRNVKRSPKWVDIQATIHSIQDAAPEEAAFIVTVIGSEPTRFQLSDRPHKSEPVVEKTPLMVFPCSYGQNITSAIMCALCYIPNYNTTRYEVFIQTIVPSQDAKHGLYPNWRSSGYYPAWLISGKLKEEYSKIYDDTYPPGSYVMNWTPLYKKLIKNPSLMQGFSTGFERLVYCYSRDGWIDAKKMEGTTATFVIDTHDDRMLVQSVASRISSRVMFPSLISEESEESEEVVCIKQCGQYV
jgi:hypothetical protein